MYLINHSEEGAPGVLFGTGKGEKAVIHVGGNTYEVIKENRNGWNPEAFRERYSDVLDRYDYIVGDWGYNQLRLKGFFKENNVKGNKDFAISTLQDYLNEYCNFGCAYFVIERQNAKNTRQGEKGGPGTEDMDEPAAASERHLVAGDPAKPTVQYAKGADNGRHPTHYNRSGIDLTKTESEPRKGHNDTGKPQGGGHANRNRGQADGGRAAADHGKSQGKPHNRFADGKGSGGKTGNRGQGGGGRGPGDGGRRQNGPSDGGKEQRGAGDAPRSGGKGNQTGAPV